jgi:hypothetical protein
MNIFMRRKPGIGMKQIALLYAIAALAAIVAGCSTSRMSDLWRDPTYNRPPMTTMLVVAGKKNAVTRRLWEDEIVATLSDHGVTATPSYRLYPDSIPNPDEVASAIQTKKFEGVLFVKKLASQMASTAVTGGLSVVEDTRYNPHTQSYSSYYQAAMTTVPVDSNVIVRNEVSVFSTDKQGGYLVWAGTGEAINPLTPEDYRDEITKLIAPQLAQDGIIPNK